MEMNVGDERNVGHSLADLFQRDRRIVVGNCKPDNLTTGSHHLFDLGHSGVYVRGVSLSHRLNHHRSATADLNVLNLNWPRLPRKVFSRSLLITKTINSSTTTNPTC